MGEALFDLEQALRSKRVTPQETSVLLACKSEAIKDFIIGASVGAGLTWFATRRVNAFLRINLLAVYYIEILAGGAFIAGMWRFGSSLDSAVDRILSMDGSRMQSEIVSKYRDNPWGMQHISKHFYVEEVFEDARPDRPKLRWRPRNSFIEKDDDNDYKNENHSNGSQSNSDARQAERETMLRPVSAMKDVKHTELHGNPRQVSAAKGDPGLKTLTDPFDGLFDYSNEEEQPYKTPSSKPATNSRKHRRAHRRRRFHHQHEDLHN